MNWVVARISRGLSVVLLFPPDILERSSVPVCSDHCFVIGTQHESQPFKSFPLGRREIIWDISSPKEAENRTSGVNSPPMLSRDLYGVNRDGSLLHTYM